MSTKVIHVARTGVLVNCVVFLAKLFLEIGEVLHDRGTVTNVALAHAFLLCGILLWFGVLDGVFRLYSRVFAKRMDVGIAGFDVHADLEVLGGVLGQL